MKPLSRPLCFLDTETTGLDVQKDHIITLAIEIHACTLETPKPKSREWKLNPGVPITPENSAIHGFTDELVKNWPTFDKRAQQIHAALQGCDFGGFNTTFDLQIITEELARCDLTMDFTGVSILDVGMIYKKQRPRRLENAVEDYLHRAHTGAHGAMADTVATREVFEAMLEVHEPLAAMNLAQLAHYSMCDERDGSIRLDLAGTIKKRKDGVIVFATKRNRDVPILDDVGYANWILRSDFPEQTKTVLRAALNQASQGDLIP